MAAELAEVGATAVVVQGAADAAADEARHRDLCAELAARWGEPHARRHVAANTRIGSSQRDPRDRLLWELVSVCCVGETMNTSLLTRSVEVATDPDIRRTLHELLKDEVRHARLGWAHLAAERACGRGEFLRDALPLMLEASIEPGFLEDESETVASWPAELYACGELPGAELVQIYRDTLDLVVFKGLDALGVETAAGRAWLARHPPAQTPPGEPSAGPPPPA